MRNTNRRSSSTFKGRDRGKSTAACELLVRSDMLKRGYEVTKPESPTAKHDLHADLAIGWTGVQVKAAELNVKTNKLTISGSNRKIASPILALVHLPTNRIEYRAGTRTLPEELGG